VDLALHPQFSMQKLAIGREGAPLMVIDNLVADAQALVDIAAEKHFDSVASYYPGVRAKAPLTYQRFILEQLRAPFCEFFGLGSRSLHFSMCHYSLMTTPPEKLEHLQRIPHIDSVKAGEIAFIHYLFKRDMGGTAFYRHRRTGFEVIDGSRRAEYFRCVEEEENGPDKPASEYINGDTALYEQVGVQVGVFNRMLIYRRNSLHSGCVGPEFVAAENPRTGRLSINGFLA
jgi:hypothetical protein